MSEIAYMVTVTGFVIIAILTILTHWYTQKTIKEWRDEWSIRQAKLEEWNRRAEEEHYAIMASLRGLSL